ncbi:MAG: hypothetical protein LBM74_04965 [Oscillospiraceae bacterium]|jgi:hypothetical protein|nr:hypothetical protein [Oscillospiraceae bacterium]
MQSNNHSAERRTIAREARGALSTSNLLLAAVLLAAGAVLKFTVGNLINFGMKPNFIIAMYCLIVLLIRPRLIEAAVIGVLAGVVCQFFPGTPYLNLASELLGAMAMCLLIKIPIGGKSKLLGNAISICLSTFLSTMVSGFAFLGLMYLAFYAGGQQGAYPVALGVFLGIILGTATINMVIVQVLYLPLKRVVKA